MFARLSHVPTPYVIRVKPVLPSARMRRPLRVPVAPRPRSRQRVPVQATFQTRPPLHVMPRRIYSSIPPKERQSEDVVKVNYLRDIFCTLTNNKVADAGTLLLLLNKITVPEVMRVTDMKALSRAVHVLGEDECLTKENLVTLLKNSDKCSDVSSALMFLHNIGILNHYTFELVIGNVPDLFSRFDLIFKMLPSHMMTMHNLRIVLTAGGKSIDLAFIYMRMNEYGIVNQANLENLYMYSQHTSVIRLMMDNFPDKCDAQTMFDSILDQVVLIKSILSYATNTTSSQDKVKTIVDLIFAHMHELGPLEHEVRKQMLLSGITHDLINQSQHSLFAFDKKNAKMADMLRNAAIEEKHAFKPKV